MKHLLICLLMTSFISSLSFAAEIDTECLMMSESTLRNNPKGLLESELPKPKTKQGGSSAQ